MKTVTIYTDGACSGNPGPGGWGAILMYGPHKKEMSGGEPQTTNNRMELTGVISALRALKEPCVVELYSDSKYVIDALEKVFLDLFQIAVFCQDRQLKKMVADIVPCLTGFLNGGAEVIVTGLLERKKVIFLLKPCVSV